MKCLSSWKAVNRTIEKHLRLRLRSISGSKIADSSCSLCPTERVPSLEAHIFLKAMAGLIPLEQKGELLFKHPNCLIKATKLLTIEDQLLSTQLSKCLPILERRINWAVTVYSRSNNNSQHRCNLLRIIINSSRWWLSLMRTKIGTGFWILLICTCGEWHRDENKWKNCRHRSAKSKELRSIEELQISRCERICVREIERGRDLVLLYDFTN